MLNPSLLPESVLRALRRRELVALGFHFSGMGYEPLAVL